MSAVTIFADALLDLALAPSVHPRVQLVLIAAERADIDNTAIFEPKELGELLADEYGKPA